MYQRTSPHSDRLLTGEQDHPPCSRWSLLLHLGFILDTQVNQSLEREPVLQLRPLVAFNLVNWLKIIANYPKMVANKSPKWSTMSLKWVPGTSQNVLILTSRIDSNWLQIVPTWFQNGPGRVPHLSSSGINTVSRWCKNGYHSSPTLFQKIGK